ncbi:MAG: AsmA family protein, partial [Legionella sp.]
MSLSLSLIYNNASHVFSGLVMRLLGKIVIALLALILLASTALWTFSQYIKPETLQRLVSNQLSAITHKKSQVDGDISWQLLPRPGLKFNKIRIGDPLARDEYIINIETLLLNLRLTALLRGQIVFSELRIEGINAVIDGDSVTEPAAEAKLHEQKSAST